MKTILYLTDLYYAAKERKYYKEDLYVTSRLKDHFHLLIGHPQQVLSYLTCADLIVCRNTGPVIAYAGYFAEFRRRVDREGIRTFNSFDGKADMNGKGYLLELTRSGYPVIPTAGSLAEIATLGDAQRYVVKLINGADSIGMEVLTREEVGSRELTGKLIQPFLDFSYEVSFYYLNERFQYALYAPDKERRWALAPYSPSAEDLRFADRFIRWNNLQQGITRVDACRLPDGSLLLVELEDLNPFLSLDLLGGQQREDFLNNWIGVLQDLAG